MSLRAARLGPWNEPLDFNLHVNWEGEPRIPFAIYVKPKSIHSKPHSACANFPQFRLLPVELQRHVIYFCDGPTLFQLMQIPVTRHEAKKLFWSDSRTWYCVDGLWLRRGGYTGGTDYDLRFLTYAEHVNICYDSLEPQRWIAARHLEEMVRKGLRYTDDQYLTESTDEVQRGMEDAIRQFWQSLRDLCPRLTHTLISTRSRRWDPWDSPRKFLGRFLRLCPAGISVSLSLLQGDGDPGDPNYKPPRTKSMETNRERQNQPGGSMG